MVIIEQLSSAHGRTHFDCGEPALDEYLRRYARQNDARGLGRTYVAVRPGEERVLGYYTLSSGCVTFDAVPEKLPRYPVPVVRLARLAVDRSAQGQHLGETLLIDALKRSLRLADTLGVYVVEVQAISDRARSFYLKYGFSELADDRLHLYLPMKVTRKLGL